MSRSLKQTSEFSADSFKLANCLVRLLQWGRHNVPEFRSNYSESRMLSKQPQDNFEKTVIP